MCSKYKLSAQDKPKVLQIIYYSIYILLDVSWGAHSGIDLVANTAAMKTKDSSKHICTGLATSDTILLST